MKFSELVEKLRVDNPLLTVHLKDIEITGVAAVHEASPGTLSYIEGGRFAAQMQTTAASALILPKDAALQA
ncbi:MAG TPA: LpxD N-terminal domain-containing protein, partial [Thermosynechococcaceae cyanobacterium]